MHKSDTQYETRDVQARPVIKLGIALVGTCVASFLCIGVLVSTWDDAASKEESSLFPMAFERDLPPKPHLEVLPGKLLKVHRDREERVLQQYAWVSEQAGTVRVPLKRALQWVAEQPQRAGLKWRVDARQ